jgi:hypothetical protein
MSVGALLLRLIKTGIDGVEKCFEDSICQSPNNSCT